MLAAIEDDHLTGHRIEPENGDHPIGNAFGIGAAAERQFGEAARMRLGRDMRRRHGWAGADGVDPDARRQRLRQGARHGPQHGLAEGVAEIGRRQVEHPLVDDVDDIAPGSGRQLRREIAREECRRFGMHGEMRVPQRLVEIGDGIALEQRGIVDQQGERAERRCGIGDEAGALGPIGEVGADGGGPATGSTDAGCHRFGLVGRGAVMDEHGPAIAGQPARDGRADAVGGAGDKGDAAGIGRQMFGCGCHESSRKIGLRARGFN